jgi:hypothetical protein
MAVHDLRERLDVSGEHLLNDGAVTHATLNN